MNKLCSKYILFVSAVLILNTGSFEAISNLDVLNNMNNSKVLDMNFDNNDVKNNINNKIYNVSSSAGKYVSSVKGNGFEPNSSKIRVPLADLGVKSSNEIVTVSFLFKTDGENNIMPISIDGTTSYSLWIYNGFFGFNTGKTDIYGIKTPFIEDRFYSVVAEFNFTDITKSVLYIDGVKQTLSYVKGLISINNPINLTGGINIAGAKLTDNYNINGKSVIDEINVFDRALTSNEALVVSQMHKIPILEASIENESYAKLDWSTEILPENILWDVGYEFGEQPNIDLIYNKNNGLGNGGQYFSNNAYTGEYSLYTPKTRPNKGNWVLYPYTTLSPQNHVYYNNNPVNFGNADYFSISYRIKSDYDSYVRILADWKYEKKFNYFNAYLTKDSAKGDKILYVDNLDWYDEYKKTLYVQDVFISLDDNESVLDESKQYRVESVDMVNKTINISSGLKEPISKGYQIKSRKSMWAFEDSNKTIRGSTDWKLVNFNTSLNKSQYIDWSEYNLNLRQGWATYGDAYMDDLKVGYATKVRLYRDGNKIYEGYDSELLDKEATDKVAPPKVSNIKTNISKNSTSLVGSIDITYNETSDVGTTYKYNISSVNNSGKETPISASENVDVISGIKGYSYVIDKIATTNPDNIIDTTSNEIKYDITEKNPSGVYYLHIKVIDKAGNIGATVHHKMDIPKITANPIEDKNRIRLDWTANNETEKIFDVYQKKPYADVYQHIALTGNRYLDDYSGKDIAPPNYPDVQLLESTSSQLKFNFDYTQDIGSEYSYYVISEDISGSNKIQSNMVSTKIVSGLMGYSYALDINSSTIPDDIIDHINGDLTIENIQTGKTYYLHVKAIDKAGNVSETRHFKIDTSKPMAPFLEMSRNDWGRDNVSFRVITNSTLNLKDVQYKINDGDWVSYDGGYVVISEEGFYKISARCVDIRDVSSNSVSAYFGIDRTPPSLTIMAPSITRTRDMVISLRGMSDSLSGIKGIRVSNYSNFNNSIYYTIDSGKTDTDIKVTIPFLADVNKNYSTRTIYVEIFDYVDNVNVKTCNVKYEPKNPQVPVIISPKADYLYSDGEKAVVTWVYDDINNDGVKLPQGKAAITLTNTTTAKVYSYIVNGSGTEFDMGALDAGLYTITVQIFNSLGKSSTSAPVAFKYNIYSNYGYVLSKTIELGTPIKYLNAVSLVETSIGTSVDGYIYYASKSTDVFNEDKKVKFAVTSNLSNDNIIELPERSVKIMVKWNLYSQDINKFITPSVDDIIVYGR